MEVGDSGVGMSDEFVQTRLFRPFNSTKESGMGIGSHESLQYVRELGGQIDVDSQPGQGTVMKVLLPLFDSHAEPEPAAAERCMSNARPPPLLIVEDDLALQKQIKWSLDRFESVTASDRETALVQLRRFTAQRGDDGPGPAARPRFGVRRLQAAGADAGHRPRHSRSSC